MSEVIVRMGMPDRCPCGLAIDNNGWFSPCFAQDGIPSREKEFDDCVENGKRPSWCPIIGVLPEQHGRLIDASTIIGEVDAGYTDDYGNPIPVNRPVSVDEYLGLEVPTIVPATERSE